MVQGKGQELRDEEGGGEGERVQVFEQTANFVKGVKNCSYTKKRWIINVTEF